MYLMNSLMPDIDYFVHRLNRYTHNPNKNHWIALCRVMKYLQGNIDLGLYYGGYPNVLEGYSVVNWISSLDETKSMSGFIFTFGAGVVTWKSSK